MRPWKEHWTCGRHSGFRLCDVLFFMFFWVIYREQIEEKAPGQHWFGAWYRSVNDKSRGEYIMCPLCLLFNRKPTKIIKCDCGKPWRNGLKPQTYKKRKDGKGYEKES